MAFKNFASRNPICIRLIVIKPSITMKLFRSIVTRSISSLSLSPVTEGSWNVDGIKYEGPIMVQVLFKNRDARRWIINRFDLNRDYRDAYTALSNRGWDILLSYIIVRRWIKFDFDYSRRWTIHERSFSIFASGCYGE